MDTVTGIHGLKLAELRQIETQGGPVLHMLRHDSAQFEGFGEVYFSEVFPGAVKAWKRHKRMVQHFAVPVGRIRFAFFDDREGSPTRGKVEEVVLGRPDRYGLLRVPRMVWYGFACVSDAPGLICNLADMVHDPDESERLPVDSPDIPFSWSA